MACSKASSPVSASVPVEQNTETSKQIAKLVAATVAKYQLPSQPDPIHIPPHHLLVSKHNRGGQPLTLMVIHKNIIASFRNDGFDPTRTPIGFVIWFESSTVKEEQVAFNLKTYVGSPLFPPVMDKVIVGATLSCSHYNCALRCYHAQLTDVDGLVCDPSVDPPLQLAVERGHKWYALSDKCPPDEQVRLSK